MENKSFLEKAFVKAEKALEATPEYKEFEKAMKAKREANEVYMKANVAFEKAKKADEDAWKAVKATPEYKPYKKAFDAYMKSSTIREFREAK